LFQASVEAFGWSRRFGLRGFRHAGILLNFRGGATVNEQPAVGCAPENIIREVTFVERITSNGIREIASTRATCRLESGRRLEESELEQLARDYLRCSEDREPPLWGHPSGQILSQMFLLWPPPQGGTLMPPEDTQFHP
jgi:hypothetical protein